MPSGPQHDQNVDRRDFAEIALAYLSHSPSVAFIKDSQFRYRYVNQVFASLFQFTIDEALDQDDYSFMPRAQADALRKNDEQVAGTGTTLRIFEDVAGADGVVRRWLVQKYPVVRENGEVWVAGTATDVTEWMLAEEDLLTSEANYRRLLESTPCSIHQMDLKGRIISMNPAGVEMFGATDRRSALGQSILRYVAAADREPLDAALGQAKTRKTLELEFSSTRGRSLHARWVPILDGEDDTVSTILAITEDITDRKEANTRLRASEERHRLVALAARDPIWEIDLKTGQVSWNDNYVQTFGVRPEATKDSSDWWESRIHPEDRERVTGSLQAVIESTSAELWSEDYRFRGAEGQELYIQDRAFISRDPDGSARRIVGTMRDQTSVILAMKERQKLLTKVQEAQRLESLGVLAGGIAHDFNNLLTVMLSNLSLLRIDSSADAEVVTELEHAVDRASEICQQMLAYAGKGRVQPKPVSLRNLIEDLARLLQASIDKGVHLDLNLDDSVHWVMADEAQLTQLVMNLVTNAAESIDRQGGTVKVELFEVELDQAELQNCTIQPGTISSRYACLQVQDDGVGMSDETRARMFEPFFTTKFTGRGMGLAAVQGIIRAHDAGLVVESTPGEGTTIRLLLPAETAVSPADSTTSTPVVAPVARVDHPRVLVIDDEDQVRKALCRILDKHGFQTEAAEDGMIGIEKLEASRDEVQLVLLDLTMPRLGGSGALRRIREIKPDVPVIMMSGYDEEEFMDRIGEAQLSGYLKKPFSATTLLGAIADALASASDQVAPV